MNLRLKRLVGYLFMLSTGLIASASNSDVTHLRIDYTSGEADHYLLTDAPSITFDEGEMLVTVGESSQRVAKNTVAGFTFTDATDGMVEAGVSGATFTLTSETLQITGASFTKVGLFAVDGKTLASKPTVGGTVTFDLSTLPAGVYVVSTDKSQTIKFVKK